MNKKTLLPVLCFIFLASACTSAPPSPTPNLDATLAVRMIQTEAARPTATLPPSPTSTLTATPSSTATLTPEPTSAPTETQKPPNVSVSEDEAGWKHFTFHREGFKISLPPSWTNLNLTADNLKAMMSQAAENNPQLADFYNSELLQNLAAAGIKFIGVDTSHDSISSGFATNLNVLISDLSLDMDLNTYADLNKNQLLQMLGEDMEVTEDRITLDGRETVVFEYTSAMNNIYGEEIDTAFRQYFMLEGRTQIVLTFTTRESAYRVNQELFDKIANSFEFNK